MTSVFRSTDTASVSTVKSHFVIWVVQFMYWGEVLPTRDLYAFVMYIKPDANSDQRRLWIHMEVMLEAPAPNGR